MPPRSRTSNSVHVGSMFLRADFLDPAVMNNNGESFAKPVSGQYSAISECDASHFDQTVAVTFFRFGGVSGFRPSRIDSVIGHAVETEYSQHRFYCRMARRSRQVDRTILSCSTGGYQFRAPVCQCFEKGVDPGPRLVILRVHEHRGNYRRRLRSAHAEPLLR